MINKTEILRGKNMTMDILTLVIWAITGAVMLTRKEIPKIIYGGTWFALMITLFCNCME